MPIPLGAAVQHKRKRGHIGIRQEQEIAHQQAGIVGKALESARIDIVGGESEFFDKITSAIASGKTIDRWVGNSQVLGDIKSTFFNGQPDYFFGKVREKGLTLVPLKIYLVRGKVKVKIGLARGKNVVDKRETIKARESDRDTRRAMRNHNK